MQEVSALLVKLGLETRRLHADVDEPWLDLLRPVTSRAEYAAQLVRTYGIVAPYESACRYTPNLSRLLPSLTNAGLIAQDLLGLGLAPSQVANVPQSHEITPFRGIAEALGWHYAIERACPLHEAVYHQLIARMPELAGASAYVARIDGHVGDTWQAFGRTLDRVGARTEVADEIIAAAIAALEVMRRWYRGDRPSHARSAG